MKTLRCVLPLFLLCLFGSSLNAQVDDTINIDLGAATNITPGGWNNISAQRTGILNNLINVSGITTGINLAVTDQFNGINENGLPADASLNIPPEASGDSFFGNSVDWSGSIEVSGGITLSNLDPATTYSFSIFASRSASDNRETKYVVTGSTSEEVTLDAASNTANVALVNDILPASDGTITIIASKGPNNNNSYGFYYMGVVKVFFENNYVPPPASLSITAPNGGEAWEIGKSPVIKWTSTSVSEIDLEYSKDNGVNWITISNAVTAANKTFSWTITGEASDNCLVRILDASNHAVGDTSNAIFSIIEDDGIDYHIVVLGSSTAAGQGPSVIDSAWVWMYNEYLQHQSTNFTITNLAVGGYATYNLLPTGFEIPSGIGRTIDSEHNISKALSLHPDAIIINLPSNDASNNYPVVDQLANYDTIAKLAENVLIPLWVCTPQPKNFGDAQDQIQLDMVDSTHAIFEEKAIDFWTGFFEDDASYDLKDIYDSGDGTHMSNAGHKLLLKRVIDANIQGYLASQPTDYFTVTPANITLATAQGSNALLNVISDLAWTASTDADWLDLNLSSGTNDSELIVSTSSENSTATSRSSIITFSPEGLDDFIVNVTQDVEVDIEDHSTIDHILVYPNPVNDLLHLDKASGFQKIEIIGLTGRAVMQFSNISDSMDLDVSQLTQGIYILRLYSEDAVQMIKLIKKKP